MSEWIRDTMPLVGQQVEVLELQRETVISDGNGRVSMDKRVKWLVILLVVILMDCAGKGFLPPTIVPEAAGSQRAFLPIVTEPGPVLYVGDNVTGNIPGVAPGEHMTVFHISDGILSLEELRYEGSIDFDEVERCR